MWSRMSSPGDVTWIKIRLSSWTYILTMVDRSYGVQRSGCTMSANNLVTGSKSTGAVFPWSR